MTASCFSSSGRASGQNRWRTLGALVSAVNLMVIDGTIINVALPTMMELVPLTFSEAEWVVIVCALMFASFLIAAGRPGGRYEGRAMMYVGLGILAIGSVVGGLANDAPFLTVARATQGLGATFVLPSTLSTVNAAFRGRGRTIASAFWGSSIADVAAIGPLLEGWLTTDFTWRWGFGINLSLATAIALAAF